MMVERTETALIGGFTYIEIEILEALG